MTRLRRKTPTALAPDHDLFVLPVGDHFLLHSPRRGLSALVNRAARDQLKAHLTGADEGAGAGLEELLRALGQATPAPPVPRQGPLDPGFLGLIPTRACNLACVYCNFHSVGASGKVMDPGLAKAAVDWMADLMVERGRDALEVHFFGGEPFLAREVMEVAVHRARERAAALGLGLHLEASSNGVYAPDLARFIEDHFNAIVLSLDGLPRHHDRQRPRPGGQGSHRQVVENAQRLGRSAVELCLRTCVTESSLESLEEATAWYCQELGPSVINFETLVATPEAIAAGLKPPSPYGFAAHCRRATRLAQGQGVNALYASAQPGRGRPSFCPVGQDTVIVSPGGRVSGCYLLPQDWQVRGLDLELGRLDQAEGMKLEAAAVKHLRRLVLHKPRCQRCFCRQSCAGGCHVDCTYPGCSLEYGDFCIQTRLLNAGWLLDELGQSDLADHILAEPLLAQTLAEHGDDRLI